MSITSVVFVPEGIAMAADSRLTGSRNCNGIIERFPISDNSQKLFLIETLNIGISTCGNAIINNITIADFLRIFEIGQMTMDDDVHTTAFKLHNYLSSTTDADTFFFVSGYENDIAFLYGVTKDKCECLRTGENYGVNWRGEIDAITKLLLGDTPTVLNMKLMPLKDGIDFAEFLIELTIKYQRFEDRIATCGGAIDVLVITKDYARFIKHKIYNP